MSSFRFCFAGAFLCVAAHAAEQETMLLVQQLVQVSQGWPLSSTGSSQVETATQHKDANPSSTLDDLSGHVNALSDYLSQVSEQGVTLANAQQEEHDRQLDEIAENISHQRLENAKLRDDIRQLDLSIADLRSKAEERVSANTKIREDVKLIHANISIAQEYVAQLLQDTHEPLNHTKDLKVLHELAALDTERSAETAHERALEKLSDVALLQQGIVTVKQRGGDRPTNDILKSIGSTMKQLMEDENASQEEFRQAFERDFKQQDKEYRRLVDEWAVLNTTKAEKTETQYRIQLALDHLAHTGSVLVRRRTSLLKFAGQLASLPKPSLQDPMSETMDMVAGASKRTSRADLITQQALNMFKNWSSSFSAKTH